MLMVLVDVSATAPPSPPLPPTVRETVCALTEPFTAKPPLPPPPPIDWAATPADSRPAVVIEPRVCAVTALPSPAAPPTTPTTDARFEPVVTAAATRRHSRPPPPTDWSQYAPSTSLPRVWIAPAVTFAVTRRRPVGARRQEA